MPVLPTHQPYHGKSEHNKRIKHAMINPCYTCRRRHVQCDRSKVPCAKCEKAGLECFDKRPLRWVKGMAIRGNMQGVSVEDASKVVARGDRVPVGLGDTAVGSLDRTSRFYLDYYNERICKLFIVYDSNKNPFRSLIALAMNDKTLLKAVLALAAQHKANTGYSDQSEQASSSLTTSHRDALAFKHQAIQGLSQAVQDVALCRQDTTLASIFLLIFLDLLESGSDRWNVHLEGAKSLISLNQPLGNDNPGQTVQEIRNFVAKQIYSIETLGATFVRPKLLSQFSPPAMLPQDTVEQSFLGCPEYLLHTIQCISHQRDVLLDTDTLNTVPINIHTQNLTTVLDSIQQFDCYLWASTLPHQSSHNINELCNLSQAYKLGALLYGQRVLEALTNQTTPQDDLIYELLGVIGSLRSDYSLFKCILWPICIAALESPWPIQREFLKACLDKFWQDTMCLNAVNAAKIVQQYWQWADGQGQESRWIFHIGFLGGDWLLI